MSKIYTNQNKTQRIKEPLFQVNRTKYRNGRQSELENVETNLLKLDLTRIESQLDDVDTSILDDLTLFIGNIDDINESVLLDDGLSYNVSGVSFLNDNPPKVLERATVWLDAGRSTISSGSISNIGSGGSSFDATFGSNVGTVYNGPKFLDHNNDTNYIYLPGNSGNYVTVEDSASLDITGDIEFVCRVALDDWSPAMAQTFMSKREAVGSLYQFRVSGGGLPEIVWWTGAVASVKTATSGFGAVDGVTYWLKATLDVDNGAVGNDVKFYYAADQASEPTVWTQLGATRTTAGTTSIDAGTSALYIGNGNASTLEPASGKFYRAIVRNGIGGPTVLDLDFTTAIVSGSEFSLPISGTAATQLESAQYLKNLGTGGNQLDARLGSTGVVDSNDPKILNHTGTNHLYLPGVVGNNANLPDSSALSSLTGNIEFVIRVALDDWTPAANQPLLARSASAFGYSWSLHVNVTSGAFVFGWFDNATSSASGVGGIIAAATAPTGLIDGVPAWLRCRFNISNRQLSVERAADSPTEPTSWGTASLSTAGASTTIYHAKAPLEMGTFELGSFSPTAGKFYRVIIRNGFSGTAVVDVDFTTGITSGNQVSVPFTGTALNTALAPQYLSNLGTGGRALVAKVGNSANADTNDPLLLTHTGENYLYMAGGAGGNASVSSNFAKIPDNGGAMDLIGTPGITYLSLPGIVGHYALTPSNAALQIAGDIDVVFGCSFNTLTPASSVGLFGRDGADPNRVWALTLTSTGALSFRWYPTGLLASQILTTSTVTLPSVGITAGQRVNLRVTLDVDNLSSSNEVKFYYSTDFGATYTQLGATITTAGVTSLSTTTSAALTINPDLGGTPFAGKVYIAVVRSGIGGTNVFISDFTTAIMGSSTFVDGGQVAVNGMLVTLTGSLAKFVDGTTFFSQATPDAAASPVYGSYCSLSDNAAFTPTTSISYRFVVAANTWTSQGFLGGHYGGVDPLRSSACRFLSGLQVMFLSPDGLGTTITTNGASTGVATITATQSASAALGSMTNGSPYALRYDYVTTGTSASVSFYAKTTSASAGNADALSDTGWTAVGTTVTANVPYVLNNTANGMIIGGLAGNAPLAGRYYAAVVKVDGVTQVNIDFTQQALYATSFTETSTNLATVTVTGGSNNDARIDRVRDIELVCRLALDDWTCATSFASQNLISKGYGSDYLWFIDNTNFQFYGTIGVASGNFITLPWSLASRPANGVTVWMKVTRNSTTGEVVLYTAPDSVTEPSSWTTVTTNTNIIGNFKGNTGHPTAIGGAVQTGSTQSSVPATGKFYRAIVRNGIGGPAVVDVDFTKSITSGAQTSVLTGGTAAQYATNLSTVSGASVMTARSGTLPASDGADPVLLPWTGENYLYCSNVGAVTNNYAYSAYAGNSATALDAIVGDIEIVMRYRVDGFTSAIDNLLMSRGYSGQFFLKITSSGYFFDTNISGASPTRTIRSVAAPIILGKNQWVKVTRTASDGSIRFYQAPDSTAEPNSWTLIQAFTSGVVAGNMIPSSVEINVGRAFQGAIYRAIVRNGIGGTIAWDADFTKGITSGSQTSFVESSVNAATVTISRTLSGRKAVAVTRPTWVFGSSDFIEVQDNALLDVTAAENLTVVAIVRQWGTPTNYGRYISKKNGNPAAGWELLTSSTTTGVFLEIADGTNTAAAPVVTPTTGALSMVGAQINRSSNTLRNFVNTTFSTTVSTTAVTGTLANAFPMRIGKRADFVGNQDFELVAVAVFKSVVSNANLATIYNYYINGGADATSILQTANFWIDAALSPPALAITRSTSDHKSVAVVRPTFLFGGNDYMEVADNDLLDFGLSDSYSVVAVTRMWATPANFGRILSKGSGGVGPAYVLMSGTTYVTTWRVDDSAAHAPSPTSPASSAGALTVNTVVRAPSTMTVYTGNTAGTTITDTTTTSLANSAPFRIGADYNAGGTAAIFAEFEMYGAAVFRRALTATEIALINTHYQGTETTESIALLSTAVFWIDPARSQQEMAINRSATGRKTVAVTRPTFLFGTDDHMEIVDNDLLNFGASDPFTLVVAVRQWATYADQRYLAKNGSGVGYRLGNGGAGNNYFSVDTAPTGLVSQASQAAGVLAVTAGVRNGGTVKVSVNGATSASSVDNTWGVSSPSTTGTFRISGQYNSGGNADMEFFGAAVFRRALTQTEITLVNTHYQGAETTESVALLSSAVFWADAKLGLENRAVINRASSGRKTVAVTRPVLLFGTTNTKSSGSYVTNLGTGGSVIDALRGSTTATGTDTVDPLWLTHYGTNYLYLPGVVGNSASTPDSAALDITGDIEIVMRVAMDNWSAAAETEFLAKRSGGTTCSYNLTISSGVLALRISGDGSILATMAGVTVPFTNGVAVWIKATRAQASGEAILSWAADSATEPTSWTVLKTETLSTGTAIFNSTSPLEVGTQFGGLSGPMAAKFYRAIVRNGIGGTTVFDANFTTGITSGAQTTFTESSANAATITINRATSGRKSVAVTRPVMLFGVDDYLEVVDNALLDFANSDSFTMFFAGRTWPTISSNQRLISKNDSTGATAAMYRLYLDSATGNPWFASGDGTNSSGAFTTTQPMTLGNLRVAGVIRDVSLDSYKLFSDNTISTGATDTLTGSMSNTSVLRIGSSSPGAGSYFEGELFGSAIFRRVLTSTEIALINTHYTTGPTNASIALLQEAVLWIDANLSNQDDHLKILDSPKIDFGNNQDFTFLALARTWGVPTSDQIIISKETQTGSGSGWSLVRGASNLLKANVEDNTGVRVSTPSLTLDQGQFRLLYGRRNSVTNKLYVGSDTTKYSVTDTTTSSLASDKNLLIGKQNFHPDSTLDAEIFAVLILPSDLTDAELLEIYNYYNNTAPETSIHTTNKLSGTLSRLLSKVQRLEKSKNV